MCLPLLALPAILGAVLGAAGSAATGGAIGGGILGASVAAGVGAGASGAAITTAVGIGTTIGANLGTIATLASIGLSTGLSISSQQQAAKAQVKQAEMTQRYEGQVASVQAEQERHAAGTKIETAAIEGSRAVGEAQASGLSGLQVARLTREARSMTLRDMSDIAKQAEFGRQGIALDRQGSALQARFTGQQARSELRAGVVSSIGSGISHPSLGRSLAGIRIPQTASATA